MMDRAVVGKHPWPRKVVGDPASSAAVGERRNPFHVVHKLPAGDGPYVRAKHVQLVEKDPEAAIVLFWKAINAGDRVDSALKDMAVVMKQQDRAEEAIEAVKSFRNRCSKQAQESLDNILIDLYKKCGRVEEQIELLKQKLRMIYQGEAFNGRPTKTARSHGKKFQVSIKQETSRVLGNLGWAYMQQPNFMAAELVYRKAQEIDPDSNKACNLSVCLIRQGRYDEAAAVLRDVKDGRYGATEDGKSLLRADELLQELGRLKGENDYGSSNSEDGFDHLDDIILGGLDLAHDWAPSSLKRLPIFEEITPRRDQMAC
ncbi:unnamed protein product [Victoria cruziana]